jgi:TPR repeat protein
MPSSQDGLRRMCEAAEAGDAVAQWNLGERYYEAAEAGDAVAQNYSEAARLFGLAADQGHASAQCSLAICYLLGRGVPQDDDEGYRRMTLASEQGHTQAQLYVARKNRDEGRPAADVPREAAREIAHIAQAEDPQKREAALALLGNTADDRNIDRTCCIGCGKTEQLQVCAKCLTAKFCSRDCQRRMWPAHKPACQAWREQKAASAAGAGGASSSVQAAESEEAVADE